VPINKRTKREMGGVSRTIHQKTRSIQKEKKEQITVDVSSCMEEEEGSRFNHCAIKKWQKRNSLDFTNQL
jgi:hypothetical protein